RLHGDNLIDTCGRCHEAANARFVQFDPHADYRDRERYPLLNSIFWYFVILMGCAFGFYGLHSLLWFIRSFLERASNGPAPRHIAAPYAPLRHPALHDAEPHQPRAADRRLLRAHPDRAAPAAERL
ncbi:MAG: hypothetical protein ACYSUF_07290, partial [Planctomycetota bacterium]